MIAVARTLAVGAAAAWQASIDTTVWPTWGPSVRGATLDSGGTIIGAGTTGRVHTALRLSLPFEVTEWDDQHSWAWAVAGVRATAHRVEADGTGRCRAVIDVPAWAPAYTPLCWVALGRLGRAAAELPDALR